MGESRLERAEPAGATPFLKWAGGKSKSLGVIESHCPATIRTYYEPFLGGGAMFFRLASLGWIRRAVISDANKDLMNCYVVIRDHIDELLDRLRELQKKAGDREFYYRSARRRFNQIPLDTGLEGDIEKASLLLYLNKTCYNGLYRVNRKGEFNVPWGRYRNPTILDESNLRAVHRMVKGKETRILCCDYATAVEDAAAGDFIYFDPPYQPISTTANFTQYTVEGFTIKEQERLANAIAQLDSKGCYCMLSNSPKVRPLYEKHGYSIKAVNVLRSISCVGNKRGPVEELLVMNYTSYRARSVL